ncbi:MAG: carboxypeptidase M32 [Caldilineales bacterium]|nr:carboxypeptidase M32 [Caldilineales bacterium]
MTKTQTAYDELMRMSKEMTIVHSIASVLGWDRETYMPKNGAGLRAEQLAYLSGSQHRMLSNPRVGELLAEIEADGNELTLDEAANVRELRHQYDQATKVPVELVEEITRVSVMAHQTWVEARRTSNCFIFQPHLGELIKLTREKADYLGFEDHPYDALLDQYEPGETTANVTRLFNALRTELVPLVQAIADSPVRPKTDIVHRSFPVDRQRLFGEGAAIAFGYDMAGGRLDTVTHPFCTGIGPGDVRITTRWNPNFFNEAFFGILHESGHGLYEQGLPADAFGGPVGDAIGMGIHESQSRLWENFVGRSRDYWRYFFPRVQQAFPDALADVSMEDFYFAVNAVEPSFIRVEADEVTYNLHIMVRFELEQAIISGDLAVGDIPAAWNETFERYLGIKVPEDSQGCLQDVHWSFGGFGYFPSYALGNLYGAQIFAAAKQAAPALSEQIASGNFQPLLAWLQENIYSQGSRYRTHELLARVTGQEPSHEPLMDYLHAKFGELYRLS